MIIFIQILLVLFLMTFPILRHVKNARTDFSLGLSFMFGLSYERVDLVIKGMLFEKHQVLFCFGPIYVDSSWLNKIGPYVEEEE
jgi:hypothetical protein